MIYLALIACCYVVALLVLWLHEVGHGLAYHALRCKGNPLRVTVRPWLLFPSPAPVEHERADQLPPQRAVWLHVSGVAAGLLAAAACAVALALLEPEGLFGLLLWLVLLLSLAESAGVLLDGGLFGLGDFGYAARCLPPMRPCAAALGASLSALLLLLVLTAPARGQLLFALCALPMWALCAFGPPLLHWYRTRRKPL